MSITPIKSIDLDEQKRIKRLSELINIIHEAEKESKLLEKCIPVNNIWLAEKTVIISDAKNELDNLMNLNKHTDIGNKESAKTYLDNSEDGDKDGGKNGKRDIPEEIWTYARSIKQEYRIKTLQDNHDIMIYHEGLYLKGEEFAQTLLSSKFGKYADEFNFKKFLHFIRSVEFTDRLKFIPPANLINTKNCVMNSVTNEVFDHNPDYNFIYKINTEYNKDAKCPEIERFLHSIVNEKDYDCLVEMLGYTLMSGMSFRNFFVLFGTGGNGKSLFMKLVEELISSTNCSFISPQSLSDDKFSTYSLYGKKVNICADIPSKAITDSGVLKQLSGNDKLKAEQKGKMPFFFQNEAKMIFSCNELPEFVDKTDALWDRIILIEFPNEFKGDNEDKELLAKLTATTELSGLLNLALEGVKRLLVNKSFSYDHDTTMERWDDLQKSKNTLMPFIKNCIVADDDKNMGKAEALSLYKAYCTTYRVRPVTDKMFNIQMRKYLGQVGDYRPINNDGSRQNVWCGIRMSDIWKNEIKLK